MAKEISKKNPKNLDYIDIASYEWTKEQANKGLWDNLAYGTLVMSMVAIYLTYGYLLVKKIKD